MREATGQSAQAEERFFSAGRSAAVGAFLLFALTFADPTVRLDGLYYFLFVRRLFGVNTPAEAYQFGSAFWTAPFWLVSQLVAVRGRFDHYHAGEIGTAAASIVAVVVTMYVGWRILQKLELPRGAAVLLLSVFGTPLWFYGVVNPSYKHAADALYATCAFWFLLRATEEPRRRYLIAAGAFLALLLMTRYVNIGLIAGALVMFAPKRWRHGLRLLVTTMTVVAVALFALPVVRGIPYHRPANLPIVLTDGPQLPGFPVARLAAGERLAGAGNLDPYDLALSHTNIDLLAPYKMLFSLHRGVFIWTPLTLFATAGFVLLLRRDRRHRRFLIGLGLGALALLELHVTWGGGFWDGGGSFSQRLLTGLFPFFLVGTAEFVRWAGKYGIVLLSICAVFSVWIGFVMLNGYYGNSQRDGIVQIIGQFKSFSGPRVSPYHRPPPHDSLENLGLETRDLIDARWRLYWRIVT